MTKITEKQIEIYQTADGETQINIHFEQDTVWLNRQQLAQLFDRNIKTIGKHINNIFKEGSWKKIQLSQNLRQLPCVVEYDLPAPL